MEEIPTLSDAIIYVKNKEIPKNKIKEEKIFETCDYSKLPDTGTALLQLLDEATPFHNKSVKPELVSFIKLVSKKIKNIEFALGDDVKKNIAFCIDIHIKIPVKNESASVELVFEKQVYFVPINDFIRLVYNTNISDSKRWNYILQSLREFVFFCVKLVETVNIVPKMVTHNQQLRLMWFPLDNDAETEKLLSFFNEIIPSSVLHFLCDEDNKTGVLKEGDINLMSALFITGIIQNIQEYIYGKKTDSEQELNKLFCGNNNSFFNEKRVVNSIHIWLKKLHVSKTRFRPIIKIDDHYPEFKASLFINDSELVNEVPVSYKDFSESKKYEKEKMGVVKNLMLLAGYFKGISQLINNVKIKLLRAKKLLAEFSIKVASRVVQEGGVEGAEIIAAIAKAREKGDTLGGVFEVVVSGVPVGLGSYTQWDRRLDGKLAQALMAIPAIKGVEIGLGFSAAALLGSKVHDEVFHDPNRGFYHKTNHAGGLEGGVTNGEELVLRAAMKPISTLLNPLNSVDLGTKMPAKAHVERSDVSAVEAAGIVGEAVVALEIANAFLEKFGGDSLEEIKDNFSSYQKRLSML